MTAVRFAFQRPSSTLKSIKLLEESSFPAERRPLVATVTEYDRRRRRSRCQLGTNYSVMITGSDHLDIVSCLPPTTATLLGVGRGSKRKLARRLECVDNYRALSVNLKRMIDREALGRV